MSWYKVLTSKPAMTVIVAYIDDNRPELNVSNNSIHTIDSHEVCR